jgi:hypothetical protein
MEPDFPVVHPWPIYMGRVNREELCDIVDFGSVRLPAVLPRACLSHFRSPALCDLWCDAVSVAGRAVRVSSVTRVSLGEQFHCQGAQVVTPRR